MRSVWLSSLATVLFLAAGCGTDPSDRPEGYEIRVAVADSVGAPFAGIGITAVVAHGDALYLLPGTADSHGVAVVRDTINGEAPDTVYAFGGGGDVCWGTGHFITNQVFPSASQHSSTFNVIIERYPPARLALGEYCGTAKDNTDEEVSFAVIYPALSIDSISADSLFGDWSIGYSKTRRPDDGRFTGSWDTSGITLDLLPDGDDADCGAHYTLVAPIVDDLLGPATLAAAGGCSISSAPFKMFAGDLFNFPFPPPAVKSRPKPSISGLQ